MNTIKICMGSSCFIRGNSENLEFIENYVKNNELEAKIEIYGQRCTNECEFGPNVEINNKKFSNMNKEKILEELRKLN